MADLDFQQVLIVGGVASVGFTLLFWWYSAVMVRRNWSYQVRQKPKGGAKAPKDLNEAPSDVHAAGAAPAAPPPAPRATPAAARRSRPERR